MFIIDYYNYLIYNSLLNYKYLRIGHSHLQI